MDENALFQQKLPPAFYLRKNVVQIAQELLGKLLVSVQDGQLVAVRIVETEAYAGATDKASHAYNNRRTARTEVMFGEGGQAYVYLCYGIHHLFNVVTNQAAIPHAVLIRAGEIVMGETTVMHRYRSSQMENRFGKGPGNLSKALGITTALTATSLQSDALFIADDGHRIAKTQIIATPRIGVDYAGADALLPYRFIVAGHPAVSGKKNY
ncbi:MAG TPA: DNA-3-methyladenine glycosylase [Chitinophagaceae bacterium]|nr:DNA-3-methyladenine glycosylase [Chitinophagaceae bacterium]HCT23746.1 DNA-3-methyladenine glycosylase [Chitinophagaceae bacterium]